MKKCDICGEREATLKDRVAVSGVVSEFGYCETCYKSALKNGVNPQVLARNAIARIGLECKKCHSSKESFDETLLFGCPDCYRNMRGVAEVAVSHSQGQFSSGVLKEFDTQFARVQTQCDGFKSADECTLKDLVEVGVVSSRIRLARNVEGVPFPKGGGVLDDGICSAALDAADGVFDGALYQMRNLSQNAKKVLVEMHKISLPLANNNAGAVIIEKGDNPEMSVMINEEDIFREQCITDGFSLERAYERVKKYDEQLGERLPLAYDPQFGYLTACPTNVGTGIRASQMLFLPALKRAGAIGDAIKKFKSAYGLTVRGLFGEGSEAAYDMYQISNSRTFGISPMDAIRQVQQASVRLCYCERVALEKLVKEQKTQLIDGIFRSFAVLTNAYSLTGAEFMKLIVDTKLGIILGVLPVKSVGVIDKAFKLCSSSPEVVGDFSDEEKNKARAKIVRSIFKGVV